MAPKKQVATDDAVAPRARMHKLTIRNFRAIGTVHVGDIDPADYPAAFIEALNNPFRIWDTAFRTHIDSRCRDLLMTMFFLSDFGSSVSDIRVGYESLHQTMSSAYSHPYGPKDFEEALQILEGSFISIAKDVVSFINPSLRDFLSSYLEDKTLLRRLAPTAKSVDWINRLWIFVEEKFPNEEQQREIASECIGLLDVIENRPVWRATPGSPMSMMYGDAANTTRIELLIAWWRVTDDIRFADSALRIARKPIQGFSMWRDGDSLIEMFASLRDRDLGRAFIYEDELLKAAEDGLIELVRWGAASDELAGILDSVERTGDVLPAGVLAALKDAVWDHFDDIDSHVAEMDNRSVLDEFADNLRMLAPKYGIPDATLERAIFKVEERIAEVYEGSEEPDSPAFTSKAKDEDRFDDGALKNLFMPLLED